MRRPGVPRGLTCCHPLILSWLNLVRKPARLVDGVEGSAEVDGEGVPFNGWSRSLLPYSLGAMRVVLLGGAPGIGKTTTARRLMEFAQAGPDLVQWIDVDALWFHRPWRVDERTKAMVHANIRAVADHAAQAGVDVLLITWVFHTADMHRLVAGLLPPGSEITSVQLHAGHEVWTRRYTGDPERGGGPLAYHEEGYTEAHAVPVDHVVNTDGLTPIEVADAVALAIGGALARRVNWEASLAQTGAITTVAGAGLLGHCLG